MNYVYLNDRSFLCYPRGAVFDPVGVVRVRTDARRTARIHKALVGFTGIHWLWKPVSFTENIHNVKPQAEFSVCCKHSHSENKNSPLWCMACQRLLLRVAKRSREAGKEKNQKRKRHRERDKRENRGSTGLRESKRQRQRDTKREREKRFQSKPASLSNLEFSTS